VEPPFRPLAGQPRFAALLHRLHLAPSVAPPAHR
jgi:hypothetical protein